MKLVRGLLILLTLSLFNSIGFAQETSLNPSPSSNPSCEEEQKCKDRCVNEVFGTRGADNAPFASQNDINSLGQCYTDCSCETAACKFFSQCFFMNLSLGRECGRLLRQLYCCYGPHSSRAGKEQSYLDVRACINNPPRKALK